MQRILGIGLSGVLVISVAAALAGNAFIWVSAYKIKNSDGMYAFFLLLISACNFAAFSLEKPILLDVAALITSTVLPGPVCEAYQQRLNDQRTLLFGYVIALMGVFLSFGAHVPYLSKERALAPERTKHLIASVVAVVIVFVGCCCFWATDSACGDGNKIHVTALWIAMYNLITLGTASSTGREVVLFLAAFNLFGTQPFSADCTDTCKAGIALIFIGLVLIVIIGALFAARADAVKFQFGEFTKTPRGSGALGVLLICLVGCILIWAGKDNEVKPFAREVFLVVLLLIIAVLEVVGWASNDPTAAFIALSIMASVVSPAVSYIYGHMDQQVRAGYIMAMTSSILLLLLPVDTVAAKATMTEIQSNRASVMCGLALLVSCMMCWASSNYDVVSGYLGIISTVAGAAGYREGILVSFYIACTYLPKITPFTSPGTNRDDYMLALVAVLALIAAYLGKAPENIEHESRKTASDDTGSYVAIGAPLLQGEPPQE
jgi:hypothetical protein